MTWDYTELMNTVISFGICYEWDWPLQFFFFPISVILSIVNVAFGKQWSRPGAPPKRLKCVFTSENKV